MGAPEKHDPIQGAIVHEYDGILEADNTLPTWWLWTFYAAILFSVGYWFYYEEFEVAPGLARAYLEEKARESEKTGKDPSDEELLAQLGTPAMDSGKQTFLTNCVACHESMGQGKIGPNLTDDAWLHGGAPLDIFRTIRDGVPAKGMPSWGPTLGRLGVTQVTAFILSLRGRNLPGKAPQGEPYQPAPPSPAGAAPEQGAAIPAKAESVVTAVATP